MDVILYPLISIFAGIIVSLVVGKFRKGDYARIIGIISLLTAIILLGIFNPFTGRDPLGNGLIILDSFGGFFIFLFLSLAIFVLLGSTKMLDDIPEMPALIMIAALGMSLVSISNDLIMLFVAWEIMSLSTYILAGLGRSKLSTEAAMKYFIYGAVSSALLLFAISLIYGVAGTTQLMGLGAILAAESTNALGVILLASTIFVFGFGYKMGMVPFHLWLPDVYEGSPAPVSAFLAGVAKKVAIVGAVRIFLGAIKDVDFQWKILFAILAVITMTIGNIAALAQKKVIRMLAYSSISQIGYILVGFAVLNTQGLAAAIMHTAIHAITTIGAFITVGIINYKMNLKTYDDYKGLGIRKPLLSVGLTIMLLSLAGIPPLAGFISKLYLFNSAVGADLLWLAIIVVLNSVLSLGYYLPLIRSMYLEKAEKKEETEDEKKIRLPIRDYGPISVNVIVTIALFAIIIFAQRLFNAVTEVASSIL